MSSNVLHRRVRRRFGERAVLSARRPALWPKICGLKTLLDRAELLRFFVVVVFSIVLRTRKDREYWER